MTPPEPLLRRSRLIDRSPVFYGWLVLAVATVGMMMTIPGQTVGVSIFIDWIIADLSMSRSQVSTLYLVGTLAGSLVLPFVGRFVDRRGPRLAVVVIAAAFALACVWMGFVQGTVTLLVGFTLIRALGQGSLSVISVHSVAICFVHRRGVAVGLLGVGMAAWVAIFPSLIERLLVPFGWRATYMLLGALVAVTILPLGGLVFRDRPERFGLMPDGHAPPASAADDTRADHIAGEAEVDRGTGPDDDVAPVAAQADYTAAEARATLTFWLFAGGLFLTSCFGTALTFHHYAILAQGGIDRTLAAAAFVPVGVMGAVGNLGTGLLITRVPPRFLLAAQLLILGAGLVLAGRLSGDAVVWVYGGMIGLRNGMHTSLEGNVFAHYFGRRHIGAIRGQVATAMVVGSSIGPLVFAFGHDLTGTYAPVMLLAAAPAFALSAVAPFLRLRRGGRVR
ncbi:MAG: MFS transporter [Trueperaceae bacterium]